MVQTYEARLLSGSSNGDPIAIAATATPGTTIHTAVSGTTSMDEVYAFFSNNSDDYVTVTIEWGSTTATTGALVSAYTLPPRSLPIPIGTGQRTQNGNVIAAFASVTNVVVCTGWVNRIN